MKNQKSLHLKQHAQNPIPWWPMGAEALKLAQEKDKPIFMSLGHASCHYCGLMCDDAFSDKDVADYLAQHFICIKVDVEEFPDLDNYLRAAARLFVNIDNWPINAFLLPDMRPYFVGSYYPKKASQGLPAFLDVLKELHQAYQERDNNTEDGNKVLENVKTVMESIQHGDWAGDRKGIREGIREGEKANYSGHYPVPMSIMDALKQSADSKNGGYFPHSIPHAPNFTFYEWASEQILEGMLNNGERGENFANHIITSVEKMLFGAVHDHARGGIHRAVQGGGQGEKWQYPYFEKTLDNQASFLKLLVKFSLIYPNALVFDAIINTLDYLDREMLSENDYFFASQSADSEGGNGLYFTFTRDEFLDALIEYDRANSNDSTQEILTEAQDKITKWFNIKDQNTLTGNLNVISLNETYKDEFYNQEGWTLIRKVRESLMRARSLRIPPMTDNKGVASSNYLLLSALVDLIQYSQIDVIRKRAYELLNRGIVGVYKNFMSDSVSGPLKIRHTTTYEITIPYVVDYIFFAESQLRIYEVTANSVFKNNSIVTIEYILREYLKDGKLYMRPLSFNNEVAAYINAPLSIYDTYYKLPTKSPLATFIGLVRRVHVLAHEKNLLGEIKELFEHCREVSLINPLKSGEAMRAFSYPQEIYRRLLVPSDWLKEKKFFEVLPYFLARFVIDYHNTTSFEVYREGTLELSGPDFQDFLDKFIPKKTPS